MNDFKLSKVQSANTLQGGAGAWIPLTNWKELPVGEWLVKVKSDRKEYHIAMVTLNNSGNKIIVAGGVFYFDLGDLIAYTSFIKYEEK